MRDEEIFSFESDSLPRSVRISCRLVEILMLANAIRADLASDEAAPLQWIAPEIDDVAGTADGLLRRFVS